MSVDSITFRSALAQWPSGVGVVTTVIDGQRHGMTASSFSSVSLNPPLVSVCLGVHLPSHALVERAGVFAISFLGRGQAGIGQRFAGMRPEVTDRFAGLDWAHAETGCPVLANATAWLDCRVVHAYPGGDHTIFVGEVLAASTPGSVPRCCSTPARGVSSPTRCRRRSTSRSGAASPACARTPC